MKMVLKYNSRTGKFTGKLNRKKLQQDAHNDYMKDKFKNRQEPIDRIGYNLDYYERRYTSSTGQG